MLKKTITYKDYDQNERTEDFYFNLTQAELVEMDLSTEGGLEKKIKNIIAAQDVPTIAAVFKDLIIRSYGQKSPNGRTFIKSEELSREFTQTEAYSKLFMELLTDENAAAAFINGIIPQQV